VQHNQIGTAALMARSVKRSSVCLSVRLPVSSFDYSHGVRRVCCWASCWREMSTGRPPVAAPQHGPQHGVQQQMRAVCIQRATFIVMAQRPRSGYARPIHLAANDAVSLLSSTRSVLCTENHSDSCIVCSANRKRYITTWRMRSFRRPSITRLRICASK